MTSDPTPRPKTVAYVTGTRADFGLMTPVLLAIAGSTGLRLRVYATGMHLMPEYGNTVEQVERAFPGAKRISRIPPSTDRQGMATFHGALTQELARVFTDERPDIVLVLGDRVEMLATANACLYLGIPVAHIHGGDVSGTVDDVARHAITRLASIHFPATTDAAARIRRMDVDASRIHVVGAPALDTILHRPLPTREEVCQRVGIGSTQPFLLVTQHPVSETHEQAGEEMHATLDAVASFDMPVVVSYPNTDAGSRDMIAAIEERRSDPRFRVIPSLPYPVFLALEREAAAWIGNSSAGVIESTSFKTPVINVGTRQQGRLRGANVIDVPHNRVAIRTAIHRALHDAAFRASLRDVVNPWGDGRTGIRIAKILERDASAPHPVAPVDRFADWQPPVIVENTPTKWQWMVRHVDRFRLGAHTDIGAFTYINAMHGVTIADDVQIGAHCAIYSVSTIDNKHGAVRLEKGCRIGTHCTIMPGVTIGENAIIGAYAFVTKDIPPNMVAYGVPARVIRPLNDPHA